MSLEGERESTWSRRVLQATKIAPSGWPILFSGLLGNAIRGLAYWRVERGISLLVKSSCYQLEQIANITYQALEQLMGSFTVSSSYMITGVI